MSKSYSLHLSVMSELIIVILITAFDCVLSGKKFDIPTTVPSDFVRKSEAIVSSSYDHSETFSSVR